MYYKCTVDTVQSLGECGEDVCLGQAMCLHSCISLSGTNTQGWAHGPHGTCHECKRQGASSSIFGFSTVTGRERRVIPGYWLIPGYRLIPGRKRGCGEAINRVWVREAGGERGWWNSGRSSATQEELNVVCDFGNSIGMFSLLSCSQYSLQIKTLRNKQMWVWTYSLPFWMTYIMAEFRPQGPDYLDVRGS